MSMLQVTVYDAMGVLHFHAAIGRTTPTKYSWQQLGDGLIVPLTDEQPSTAWALEQTAAALLKRSQRLSDHPWGLEPF